MPEPKHQCGSCRYFQNAQLTGNGWCTHPARQPVSDVKILVRERELACRNVWGDDLWTNSSSPATTYSAPVAPRRPFIRLDVHLEDEVTSVTDASIHATPAPTSDDVVTVTSVRRDDAVVTRSVPNDVNIPAVDDQAERARMMARGNGPAIRSARERHVQRRTSGGPVASESDALPQDDVIITTPRSTPIAEPSPPTVNNATEIAEADATPSVPAHTFAIDHVDSDVGLPRLRSFLRVSPEAAESVNQSPAWSSQFDHVFRQAERIKKQSRVTQQVRASLNHVVRIETSSDTGTDTTTPADAAKEHSEVVWDVNPAVIDVAFGRARPADTEQVQTDVVEDLSLETVEFPLEYAPVADSQPIQTASVEHTSESLPTEAMAEDVAEVQYSSLDDDEWIEDSPKGSWWRSLNFGLSRRIRGHQPLETISANEYLPYPNESVEYLSEDDDTTEWLTDDTTQMQSAPHLPVTEAMPEPEQWYADAQESTGQWEDDFDPDEPFELDTPTVNQYVTSEENWMLDEREFPAPQPTEWHDYRAALLASLPPIESLDDAVEWIAATPQSTPVEPLPPIRPRPDPKDFIDVDAPGGMNTFLTSLFQRANRPTDHFMAPIERSSPTLDWTTEPTHPARKNAIQSSPGASHAVDRPSRQASTASVRESQSRQREARPDDSQTRQTNPVHQDRRESRPRATRVERSAHQMSPSIAREDLDQVPIARADGSTDKRCLTCRSYAPSDERGRGRCTNEWSKTNRAIVEADDLACHSSLGDWWIAADATWIPPESVIRPQTPRTEVLLNHLDDQQSQRAPVRKSKRVRTSNVG